MSDYWQAAQSVGGGMLGFLGLINQVKSQQMSNYWADKNFGLAEDAFAYNKSLNKLQMEREDTAVQRRVADLEAAGLHPALATGQGAAAQPMQSVSAPQRENNAMQHGRGTMEALQFMSQLSVSNAQKELLKAQAKKADAEADSLIPAQVSHMGSQERLEGLRGKLYEAQKDREERYYSYMPDLHKFEKEKAEHLLKVTAQISHDLQWSQDHDLRTTDHNQWATLLQYLASVFSSLLPDPRMQGSAPAFNHESFEQLQDLYEAYRKITEGIEGIVPMSFDEFRKTGGKR